MRSTVRRVVIGISSAALTVGVGLPTATAATGHDAPSVVRSQLLKSVVVQNLNDSGPGSLRSALSLAAGSGVTTRISFAKAGTITLTSALPVIRTRVILDGVTAPGHQLGGPPVVGIDFGKNAGLRFSQSAARSEVLGLSIGNAKGDAISSAAPRMRFAGNYIGLAVDGSALANGGDGIHLLSGARNSDIGLNPLGVSGWVSNVISANAGNGIVLDGVAKVSVVANRIGTDPSGSVAVPNGRNGVLIKDRARSNVIGGTSDRDSTTGIVNDPTGDSGAQSPTFVVPPLGNLISGNSGSGVLVVNGATRNSLHGNFIGTSASGDAAVGNGKQGVWLRNASRNKIAGGTLWDQPFAYYNVISGNGAYGIKVDDSHNVAIQGNFVGIGADNATVVGNGADGIWLSGTTRNTLVGGRGPLGNVASGNGHNGIALTGTVSGFRSINNVAGLFALGGAAPNQWDGIWISSSGGNNAIRSSITSGNVQSGIALLIKATGVTVQNSISGLDHTGTSPIPNLEDGITISGVANRNVIGDPQGRPERANYVAGNLGNGITLTSKTSVNAVVSNVIGYNKANALTVNGGPSIVDSGRRNIVKGNTTP